MKTTYEKKIIDSFIDDIKLSGGTVEKIDGNYICISENIGYIYAALKQSEPDPNIKAVVIYPDDSRILPFYSVKGYKSIPAKYNPGTVSENEYINAKTGNTAAVPELWNPDRRRCSYSNEKTGGIPSVSILAGSINANYSGAIPWNLKTAFNVCGTCSADCPGCYAKKLTRYPDKYIQLALNTIEAKTDPVRFFELVEKELFRDPWTDPRVVRLHDSGEFFSIEYFSAAMDFINRHPGTVFGTYSKEAEIINEYGINNLPANLCLSCSPWKGYCEPIGDLPQFIYDDGTDPEIAALKHCPAVDKNGKKTGVHCMQCKHCYTARRGSRIAVYAH